MKNKRLQIIIAFALVYIVWGSTYLAIRFTIETLPAFTSAGLRFLCAGLLLFIYCGFRGLAKSLTLKHWKNAAIIGGLLLLGGNASVVWAEQYIPSGMAALFIAVTPWWMVLLEWLVFKGQRPKGMTFLGLCFGLLGVGLLVAPAFHGQMNLMGAIVLLLASLWWSIGSLYSRHAVLPSSALMGTAMQMITGGSLLLLFSGLQGEWTHLAFSHASLKSVLAFFYLLIFGSLVGFTAYIWLLSQVRPALVSTYAFVNPVVAVFLGWALASEKLTPQTILAAVFIVAAVVLITLGQKIKVAEAP